MNPFDAALLLATTTGLVATLLTLHKVRKIHLATYDLQSAAKETRSLFSQLQALFALERTLGLEKPLPPLRGWAGSPDFLLIVAKEILSKKPNLVMECSSGTSTLVIARCLQLNGSGHVYSLEHDSIFAEKTRNLIAANDLSAWATVIHAPLSTERTNTPWYSESAIPPNLLGVDILVVDGPPSTVAPMARFPALPRLIDKLSKPSLVIVDDTDRDDDSRMIKLWLESFPGATATDCNCEKGCTMLRLEG